ncbi:MAG: hypothetical protein ACREOW_16125 [Thermodesulfobacteriota bacterium]
MRQKLIISLFSFPLLVILSMQVLRVAGLSGLPSAQEAVDKPYSITVGVGQAVSICTTGTIICPARSPICDDTSVATVRGGESGLEIVGVKPGTTLCSVVSATAFRTIYAVTVR